MKFRAGPELPALKKGAGSEGLKVARLMSSMRASANAKSPRSSARLVDVLPSLAILVP